MPSSFLTSGLGDRTFHSVLQSGVRDAKPAAMGLAVAYISTAGIERLQAILAAAKVSDVCVVTDTRDCVTHPNALKAALSAGWGVRVVSHPEGTFHPKLYLGGASFDKGCGIVAPALAIVGSANLSNAALFRNGECSYIKVGSVPVSAGKSWRQLWGVGQTLTEKGLVEYGKAFSKRNRSRTIADMLALGVSDNTPVPAGSPTAPPAPASLPASVATVAWVGLQSFTGDYNLQVEFPRDAGEVLRGLLGDGDEGDDVQLRCSDGIVRDFKFRFYKHNGMFRLNVPNSVPLVEWVRMQRLGIAVVQAVPGEPLTFDIVKPGAAQDEFEARSNALGTWGKTSTRKYGWC